MRGRTCARTHAYPCACLWYSKARTIVYVKQAHRILRSAKVHPLAFVHEAVVPDCSPARKDDLSLEERVLVGKALEEGRLA
eukprot:6203602-Pleurochrysis_carterae.AAC.4